jgi:hypothetical protein
MWQTDHLRAYMAYLAANGWFSTVFAVSLGANAEKTCSILGACLIFCGTAQ